MKTSNFFNFLKFAALIVAVFIFLSSCKKESNDELTPSTDIEQVEERNLGCEMLPAGEYANLAVAEVPNVSIKATVLNLNVPPVANQGSEGSCVAFGTTYAARSINWKSNHPASWSYYTNIFSPEYVYNQIKISTCGSGSYVVSGLNLLKNQGVCTWSIMPYVNGQCSILPTTTQRNAAAVYKISGYGTVPINASSIKSFLAAGKPVIVAGRVNNAYVYLPYNGVLSYYSGSTLGGHCYCVVGFDDNKQAFKFMNSWGPYWSTAGFGYIAYAYINSWWSEAYVIN